jgi:bifunctional non-homologous end joining protein LigD
MRPELVIQVAFQDWTQDGILRQPRYLGLRQDRDPKTVVREEPAHTEDVVKSAAKAAKPARTAKAPARATPRAKDEPAQLGGMRLTHPERVLFPHDGVTKLQLAQYFAAVGEAAMPHYRERPLSILRNTHGSRPFFQKHYLEQSGAGLRVVKIPNADKDPDFVVCDSPEGLLHLAQVGAVELHSWGAVMPKPTQADRLTFDLDPGADLDYAPLRDAALAIRKLMQDLGLESWVKTTGGKGLHVVVPLSAPRPDWETARDSRATSRCSWSASRPRCSRPRPARRTARRRSSSTTCATASAPRPWPRTRHAGDPASASRHRSPGTRSTRTSVARISTCTMCRSASRSSARIPGRVTGSRGRP